jgi:thiol-disulfide isomerase/thioredoxin
MKKRIFIIVLALLCQNFCLKAQSNTSNTGLKLGDQVPDITINNIFNYKGPDGKPATSAKISDFKGKLLILDFWATWCSPCVEMLPRMDSLQQEFEGKIQFLPVAYQSRKEVDHFLKKKVTPNQQSNLPRVTGDSLLTSLFPHHTLPHYVWIDQNGTVCQITDMFAINKTNVAAQLNHTKPALPQKTDPKVIDHDLSKPFLVNHNGGDGQNFIYHSIISGYTSGLRSMYNYQVNNGDFPESYISCTNMNLQLLYRLAYSDGKRYIGDNRVMLNVKAPDQITTSTLHGADYRRWMSQGKAFCYEIRMPAVYDHKIFQFMREDLDRLFPQYLVKVEKRKSKCIALVRTSGDDKIRSTGGNPKADFEDDGCDLKNTGINQFTGRLDAYYLQNSAYPVVDFTGYTGKVDMTIAANLGDLASINLALQKYDLKFVETDLPVDMLIISDNKQ